MPLVEFEKLDGDWLLRQYGSATVSPPSETTWSPSELTFIARPTGSNYVRLEDIPGVGNNLRLAAVHAAAHNKVITLPPGIFEFNDFTQGDGNKWMHGLMVNPSMSTYHCRGFVGSGAGTIIQMVPNSSHFTMENGSTGTESTTQFSQTTIWFYNVDDVEFGNLVVQGQPQPHYHHGIRINGDRAHVHHCRFMGAALGGYNMPPAETYSLGVGGVDSIVEDCEFDGRRSTSDSPISSTVIGALNATDLMLRRIYCHDLYSGFGVVQWEGNGMTTEDMWVVRPGTGTGGWNGAHTNHEKGAGPIRHIRPHIILDGWWGPTDGKVRRNNSKFPHFIFLRPDTTEDYVDVEIIDPVFDSWGGLPGGFAIMLDEIASNVSVKPKVKINGQWLTGVVRPQWWIDSPAINVNTQYWIGANSGDGSVWG